MAEYKPVTQADLTDIVIRGGKALVAAYDAEGELRAASRQFFDEDWPRVVMALKSALDDIEKLRAEHRAYIERIQRRIQTWNDDPQTRLEAFAITWEKVEQLRAIVADLTDPDECTFDHHGYCQAHAWLTEGECPHARAKKLLGGAS